MLLLGVVGDASFPLRVQNELVCKIVIAYVRELLVNKLDVRLEYGVFVYRLPTSFFLWRLIPFNFEIFSMYSFVENDEKRN